MNSYNWLGFIDTYHKFHENPSPLFLYRPGSYDVSALCRGSFSFGSYGFGSGFGSCNFGAYNCGNCAKLKNHASISEPLNVFGYGIELI
jgi:hypothetical protein